MRFDAADVTAAILAGGHARRFGGRDKAALDLGGERIIDRQLSVLRELTDRTIIVTNAPGRYAALGVPVVADLIPGAGPLGGIYTGIVAGAADCTLVVACDLPFLRTAFLEYLVAARREADVVLPRTADGRRPLCACYARAAADPIRRLIDAGALKASEPPTELRVREIGPEEIARFDPDAMLFENVNTPDDYARILARLERQKR